jgi:uncharacterized repeat protein (TIGR01451 family)
MNSRVSDNKTGDGGLFNWQGTATLDKITVTGNSPQAIVNGASLTLTNSTVSGNTAGGSGGGAISNSGTLTVSASTLSGNSTYSNGGGLENHGYGTFTIENSTISGNNAGSGGGGIENDGYLDTSVVDYSTITGNSATFGGGIYGGSTTLRSTIITGQITGGNCAASISDGGYNLDDGSSCGFSSTNNSLSNTNPLLDPARLQDNGGPTQTIALELGSPAIDAIPSEANGCGTTITNDQRGVSRPQRSGCDIGAFELVHPGADLSITKSGAPNPVLSGNRLTYTLTVTNKGPRDATSVTVTDALPGSLHFNRASSSQGTCTRSATTNPQPKGGTVSCSVGNLANGAKASITIVVTATTPGTLINTAKVSGNEIDPDPSNNSATATTTVVGT